MPLRIILLAVNDLAIKLVSSWLRGCEITLVRRPEEIPAMISPLLASSAADSVVVPRRV
jgi:hypothetical protein